MWVLWRRVKEAAWHLQWGLQPTGIEERVNKLHTRKSNMNHVCAFCRRARGETTTNYCRASVVESKRVARAFELSRVFTSVSPLYSTFYFHHPVNTYFKTKLCGILVTQQLELKEKYNWSSRQIQPLKRIFNILFLCVQIYL